MEHLSRRRNGTTDIARELRVKTRMQGATHNVLVRVHINLEPVLLALSQHANSVVYELIVVLAPTNTMRQTAEQRSRSALTVPHVPVLPILQHISAC